ncbi:hypothetical protein B296_00035292, partial [Ensete ventricosum]
GLDFLLLRLLNELVVPPGPRQVPEPEAPPPFTRRTPAATPNADLCLELLFTESGKRLQQRRVRSLPSFLVLLAFLVAVLYNWRERVFP